MAEERIDVLVVRDAEGAVYALPWALVEQARVRDEDAPAVSRGDVSGFGLTGGLGGTVDALGEMSEMTSLRLQMAMDRYSKLMQTMANVLQNSSGTQAAITQNLR